MVLEDKHHFSVSFLPIQGIRTPVSFRGSWAHFTLLLQSSHGNSLSVSMKVLTYPHSIYPNVSPKNDRLWHVFTPHPFSLIHVIFGFSSLNHPATGVSPFQSLEKSCLSAVPVSDGVDTGYCLSTSFDNESGRFETYRMMPPVISWFTTPSKYNII